MNGGYTEDYPEPIRDIPVENFRKMHMDNFEKSFPELYGKWLEKPRVKSDLLPYFAAHALAGMLAKTSPAREIYELAWEIADEMVRIGTRRGGL